MHCLPERSDLDQSQPTLICPRMRAEQLSFPPCLSVPQSNREQRKVFTEQKGPKGPASPLQSAQPLDTDPDKGAGQGIVQ